jgi:hypothetical protein
MFIHKYTADGVDLYYLGGGNSRPTLTGKPTWAGRAMVNDTNVNNAIPHLQELKFSQEDAPDADEPQDGSSKKAADEDSETPGEMFHVFTDGECQIVIGFETHRTMLSAPIRLLGLVQPTAIAAPPMLKSLLQQSADSEKVHGPKRVFLYKCRIGMKEFDAYVVVSSATRPYPPNTTLADLGKPEILSQSKTEQIDKSIQQRIHVAEILRSAAREMVK